MILHPDDGTPLRNAYDRGYWSRETGEAQPEPWHPDRVEWRQGAAVRDEEDRDALYAHPMPPLLCRPCREQGRMTRATELDHLDGDPRNHAIENLRPLCKDCREALKPPALELRGEVAP
jgi:hypothetical protein